MLLVEDDPNDVLLLKHAFEKLEVSLDLETFAKGEEALSFLKEADGFSEDDDHFPYIIILDLKLPGKSGFDVLKWIREQDDLQHVPVIILSSSAHKKDILKSYRLGANSYLVKPVNHDDLIGMVRTIKDYWLDLNRTADFSGDI
ncbi:MAG: response regulator [Thermoplasmatota archaeon]